MAGELRFCEAMCGLGRHNRGEVCDEAHKSRFSIHPGGTMRYSDLRVYWCKGMKREVADGVASCYMCQRVLAKYQRPVGPLLPVSVAEWM